MRNFKRLLTVGLLALGCGAAAQADSFDPTNTVNSGATIISWPTNAAGTNGIKLQTGGKISVIDYEHVGFYASGLATTNTNSTVTVTLVRAWTDNPPQVIITNGQMTRCDWENPGNGIVLSVTVPASGVAPGTNAFAWGTNLDAVMNNANWLGIWSITNANAGGNAGLTNFDAGLNKRTIPTRLK